MVQTKNTDNRKVSDLTDLELATFCGLETAEHGAKVREKCQESNWKTTSAIPSGMVINLENTEQALA